MKLIDNFYRMVNLLEQILFELKTHNRDFQEYKRNLNQVQHR